MFNGIRLRQVRELRRLTQAELARRVGKSQGTLANIERGISQPSEDLIGAIAAYTRFPAAFFSTKPYVEFPLASLMLRARASTTRGEIVAACRYAEIMYEVCDYLTAYVDPIPVRLRPLTIGPQLAAQQTRKTLGIMQDVPVPHFVREVEKSGVVVLALPVELERIDAFSAWVGVGVGEGIPVVAICAGVPGDRLRWSVAHELGHLILHADCQQLRKEHHEEADRFAAEFLLPENAMHRELPRPVALSTLAPLKLRWRVALQALIRRAHELRTISRGQYAYLFEQLSVRGWRTREPSNLDVPTERPRALLKMAEVGLGCPVDFSHIAADMRLSERMVREIFSGYDAAADVQREPSYSSKVVPLLRQK